MLHCDGDHFEAANLQLQSSHTEPERVEQETLVREVTTRV